MVEIAPFVNTLEFMLLFFFLVPATITLFIMPQIIRKMAASPFVVKDMYKPGTPKVPTNGGLIVLLIAILSLSILSLFYSKYVPAANYTVIVVVALFALFGLLDDMVNIGRIVKLIFLYYGSYLLIPLIATTELIVPFLGAVDLGIIYLQLIIPTYVPVVANLVNMHSGFNGLAPGVSLLILVTLLLKIYVTGNIFNVLFVLCLTGALAGYFWYERYPSRMFWGNTGALAVGSAIGATMVLEGFIVSGFIMLLPHTVNFLLYVYWRVRRYPLVKFGSVTNEGFLLVPSPLTLKWVAPYYVRMKELPATLVMYGLTGICCVVGFYVPG